MVSLLVCLAVCIDGLTYGEELLEREEDYLR